MIDEQDYENIRKQNLKEYGEGVNRYGPKLLANLYSDRIHFLYELLQNAEDAIGRSDNPTNNGIVRFDLFHDRLEFSHYGAPFTLEDIQGICGIDCSTKKESEGAIGKFGGMSQTLLKLQ